LGVLVLANCAGPTPRPHAIVRSPTTETRPLPSPVRTIVVDAGHGGKDPGASHFGLREKDLALDIARRLRDELSARGLSVVMTRDRDEFIALSRRPGIANRIPADLFVSVHINANRSRKVSGVEVYYPRESVVDTASTFPPGIEAAEVALPTWTVKQILWDLVLVRSRKHSSRMASHICRSMRDRLGVPCRGVKRARFVVLREAKMPAVLVETGYVSNQSEASRLGSASYRQAIAESIAEGIVRYTRELGAQHISETGVPVARPTLAQR
jgi:N-acetylmuramoyl-L-alanine amidase